MYKLKEGIVLRPFGGLSLVNNDNLTDELAAWMIETGRVSVDNFEGAPELVVGSAPEPVAEFWEAPATPAQAKKK